MCVRCGTGRIAWCTHPMRHQREPRVSYDFLQRAEIAAKAMDEQFQRARKALDDAGLTFTIAEDSIIIDAPYDDCEVQLARMLAEEAT